MTGSTQPIGGGSPIYDPLEATTSKLNPWDDLDFFVMYNERDHGASLKAMLGNFDPPPSTGYCKTVKDWEDALPFRDPRKEIVELMKTHLNDAIDELKKSSPDGQSVLKSLYGGQGYYPAEDTPSYMKPPPDKTVAYYAFLLKNWQP